MAEHPTSELVGVAWLRGITGLAGNVSTALPADTSTWSASGFVQVTTIGGTPAHTFPIARPVLSLDFWAVAPDTGRQPWARANRLAEQVRAAVLDHANTSRAVALPAAYNPARVVTAWLLTEPRRVRSDDADLAHYTCDLALHWVEDTA